MLLKEYLQDPCRSLSIPYWKAKTIRVPKDMLILHDDHFREFADENYHDETFFRLYHNMENIRICNVEGFRKRLCGRPCRYHKIHTKDCK